jgi:hypothetical protein
MANGAWAILHRKLVYKQGARHPATAEPDESWPAATVQGRWTLAYLLPNGRQALSAEADTDAEPTPGELELAGPIAEASSDYGSLYLELLEDFNRDGIVEVLGSYHYVGEGESRASPQRVLTVKPSRGGQRAELSLYEPLRD